MRRAARKAAFYSAEDDAGVDYDIGAESVYKREIKALRRAGRDHLLKDGEWRLLGIALWLVPEPANAYDQNAVMVATGPDPASALTVGYIFRDDAARLQPRLPEPFQIKGVIVGKRGRYGVKLHEPTIKALLAGD